MNRRQQGMTHKACYLRLLVAIAITCLILYVPVIFGNNVLVYRDIGYDTFHQYLPAYQFFANLLHNGGGEYSFSYGMGTTIYTSIGWIADPITLLNVLYGTLFGVEKIAESIVYTQIIRIICAGLLCLKFLQGRGYSDKACMASAYVYAFSGYMITSGEHYAFATLPIYFILLLICIDRAFEDKRRLLLLSVVTALFCVKSIYSAYQALLVCVWVVIVRAVQKHQGVNHRSVGETAVFGVAMAVGILMSAAVFLPCAAVILQSPRLNGDTSLWQQVMSSFRMADFSYIRSCMLRLFSSSLEGPANNWQGATYHWEIFSCFYSACFVPMLAQYIYVTFAQKFSRGNRVVRLLPIVVIIFCIVNYFLPSLFNAFAYPAYRFSFVCLPFFAIVFAESVDNVCDGKGFHRGLNYMVLLLSCVVIGLAAYRVYQSEKHILVVSALAAGGVIGGGILLDLMYLAASGGKEKQHDAKLRSTLFCLFAFVLVFNLFGENAITLYAGRVLLSKDTAKSMPLVGEAAIRVKRTDPNKFYRMETTVYSESMPDMMYALREPFRSVSYYDTTINRNLPAFTERILANNSSPYSKRYLGGNYGLHGEALMADMLGIKYLYSSSDIESSAWKKIDTIGCCGLYQNTDLSCAGLLYQHVVEEASAEKESTVQRYLGLADHVILADTSNYAQFCQTVAVENTETFEIFNPAQPAIAAKGVVSAAEIDGKALRVTIEGENPILIIPLNEKTVDSNDRYVCLSISSPEAAQIVSVNYLNSSGEYVEIFPQMMRQIHENGVETFFFVVPQCIRQLNVCFNDCAFAEVSFSADVIAKRYTNEAVLLDNPKIAGKISGTVYTNADAVLYLPVLYDSNWTASVDGTEVEISKANYAFSAIPIPAGEHQVVFSYENTLAKVGKLISISSISAWTLVVLFLIFKGKYPLSEKRGMK